MKKLATLLLTVIFSLLIPISAIAEVTPTSEVDCSGVSASSAFCEGQAETGNPLFGTDGILTKAARIITIVTGIISMFIMAIAGLRFVMSSGDSAKIESAKNAILYSSIGLVVSLAGQAIVSLVLNNL